MLYVIKDLFRKQQSKWTFCVGTRLMKAFLIEFYSYILDWINIKV